MNYCPNCGHHLKPDENYDPLAIKATKAEFGDDDYEACCICESPSVVRKERLGDKKFYCVRHSHRDDWLRAR